jgi:hypothetical protein
MGRPVDNKNIKTLRRRIKRRKEKKLLLEPVGSVS